MAVWHFPEADFRWKLILSVDLMAWYVPDTAGFETGTYVIGSI